MRLWEVLRREFLERVRGKAFIVSTIVAPVVLVVGMGVPQWLALRTTTQKVAIIDASGELKAELTRTLLAERSGKNRYKVLAVAGGARELTAAVLAGELDAYVELPKGVVDGSAAAVIAGRRTTDLRFVGEVRRSIAEAVVRRRLEVGGLAASSVDAALREPKVETIQITRGGRGASRGIRGLILGVILLVMLTIGTVAWASALTTSVLEEKNNRVVEVMLSAASPAELFAGKLLGIGAAATLQFGIWGLVIVGALVYGGWAGYANASWQVGLGLAGFFVLGFLLYGAASLGLGAMVNSQQDANQLGIVVHAPTLLTAQLGIVVLSAPDGGLAVGLSLFPLTAPVAMLGRLAVGDPAGWQVALSVVLTAAAIVGLVWVASRVYRVGILMYGKRPTFSELVRWIRY